MALFLTKRAFFAVFLLTVLGGSSCALAAPELRVDGLFSGRAMITINGEAKLLRAGETGPYGVKLVSSDSKQAVLEVDGKIMTLGLSEHISASYSAAEPAEVRLLRGDNGHYFVDGYVNGHLVNFLVDTGASSVSMNVNVAKRLGLNYRSAPKVASGTANGVTMVRVVTLDKLTIGNITQYKVSATVHAGDSPQITLLGNSFLSNVEMREEGGALVLRQKF